MGEGVEFLLDGDVRLLLDSQDELSRLLMRGTFENDERSFVRRFLRSGDVFFDVGANIGVFTLVAARAVGERGHVHAFEPYGRTFEHLAINVRLNDFGNVVLNRVAVSDENGHASLNIARDGHDAWNSLAQLWDGVMPDAGRASAEVVRTVRLDDYVRSDGVGTVDLLKLDVEGWEIHALSGGTDLFSAPDAPTCLVEFCDVIAAAAGTSSQILYERLAALGYQVFRYDAAGNSLSPEPFRGEYPYDNLVCTKHPAELEQRLSSAADCGASSGAPE